MKSSIFAVASATLLLAGVAIAQEVNGSLTANGKSAALKYAVAQEVDSATEKGYMDVIVVLSDRRLAAVDLGNIVSSAAFIRWKPTAYDEKRVAGRFWTEGTQSEFRQQWSYDVTFSAPIRLDPAAKTAPKK